MAGSGNVNLPARTLFILNQQVANNITALPTHPPRLRNTPRANKKAGHTETTFGNPAIFSSEDPTFSAPSSRRVWLYREIFTCTLDSTNNLPQLSIIVKTRHTNPARNRVPATLEVLRARLPGGAFNSLG